MPRPRLDINRKLTGWIALVFLVGGFIGMMTGWFTAGIWGGMLRNGLVLGALWLALPTQNRPAAWEDISWSSVVLVLITVLVLVSNKLKWYAIPVVIGVGALVYFLRRPLKR